MFEGALAVFNIIIYILTKRLQKLWPFYSYQNYPRILLPNLGNKMRYTVEPQCVTYLTDFAAR